MKTRLKPSEAGFTIIELMMAMGLFALVIVALMAAVTNAFVLVQLSSDRAPAIKEAQIVLNNLKISADQAAVFPADVVTAFPVGVLVPPRTTLPGEIVTITYADPLATPLFATVTVQWVTPQGRPLTESLSTVLSGL